jgi:predicted nucleotidyltransferase
VTAAIASGVRSPEAIIVDRIERAVRADAVILCGSRVTGDAVPASDYDVFVVVPSLRIPAALRELPCAASDLSKALGVTVSLNPLPRFRLHRPGRTFIVWKALHEGRVLSGRRPGVSEDGAMPDDPSEASSSYALSGIHYLLLLDPHDLAKDVLPTETSRGVQKALLHAAQLELLARGRYASRLEECLPLLEDTARGKIAGHAAASHRPEAWFAARALLLPFVRSSGGRGTAFLLENTQYVVLARLRGQARPLRELFAWPSVAARIENATVALAAAIRPGGDVDAASLLASERWLPSFLRPARGASWTAIRDVVEREWPHARPLVGL